MTADAFDPRGWLCHEQSGHECAHGFSEVALSVTPSTEPTVGSPRGGAAEARGRRAQARRPRPALDKKGIKNSPELEPRAQRARRLRKVAAKYLHGVPFTTKRKGIVKRKDHAVVTCGSYAGFGLEVHGQKAVMLRKGQSGAFFAHAVTCGSVSTCPVCASKIAPERCAEVAQSVDAHHAIGGAVGLLTLTQGHTRADALKPQLTAMQQRWMAVKNGKSWKLFCQRVGLSGGVTSREVTHGWVNGWHPHLHVLLFFAPGTTSKQIFDALEWLRAKWASLASDDGHRTSDRAQDFRLATSGKDAGEYLTKHGVEWEMTHAHMKNGKSGRSPWQLLDSADKRDRALFVEYAQAFYGAKMLTWFGDVRVDERTDEEVARAHDDDAEDVAIIPETTLRLIKESDAEDAVYRAAERGGLVAVIELLKFLRCGECHPPEHGRKFGKAFDPPDWRYQYKEFFKC